MDTLLTLVATMGPQHWLVIGLVLLIAEMASGTTYLLWPAVAAFITALVSWFGFGNWLVDFIVFSVLVIALTAFGHPLVKNWRAQGAATGLNDRAMTMIGVRGSITAFANGAGSVKIQDTVWRVTSDEALAAGEVVVVESVDGATLKVKRAG